MPDPKRVLIIGETPERIDVSDPAIPKGVTAETIRAGLEASLNDLRGRGRVAQLVYTDTEATAPAQVEEALARDRYDVIVVGAGLRIVPKHTRMFELIMNVVHAQAPQAKLAFNTSPDDSANAAERILADAT